MEIPTQTQISQLSRQYIGVQKATHTQSHTNIISFSQYHVCESKGRHVTTMHKTTSHNPYSCTHTPTPTPTHTYIHKHTHTHSAGWMYADPICSMCIALMIFVSVIPLLRSSACILLQRTPFDLDDQLDSLCQRVCFVDNESREEGGERGPGRGRCLVISRP